MLIQLLISLFVIFALVKVFGRYREHEIAPGAFIFWVIFWLSVLVVIWQPEISTQIANRLGVGRGSDLVTYFSLAAIFYLIFRLMVRLERIEKNITKVVRHLALHEKIESRK